MIFLLFHAPISDERRLSCCHWKVPYSSAPAGTMPIADALQPGDPIREHQTSVVTPVAQGAGPGEGMGWNMECSR